jgi:copper chaperone CopZ
MPVKGMTCADCQDRVADALGRAGARDVRVDYRRGQVLLDPVDADESRLRIAVEELGYRTASLRPVPSDGAQTAERPSSGQWSFLLLLLPLICCGGPLLLIAIASSGAGAWLAANGMVIASLLALAVSLVFLGLWIQRRQGRPR